jgi:AcrR family transcriptional regulator
MRKGVAQNDRKGQTGQIGRGPRGALGQSIVKAATQEFLERGYKRTSIESVARAAGIAKGTVYLYFKTKEEVFRAASQAFIDWFLSEAKAGAAKKGTVEEQVARVLRAKFGAVRRLSTSSPFGTELLDASNGVSGDLYRQADKAYVKVLASVLSSQPLAMKAEDAAWLVFHAAEKSDALDALAEVMVRGLRKS